MLDFICVLQEGVSISHSPLAFPKLSPTGLQRQMFCGLIFRSRTPGLGSLMRGSDPLLFGEKSSCNCNYPPVLCVGYLVVWVLTMLCVCLYCSSSVPLYLLVEGLLVFRLFSIDNCFVNNCRVWSAHGSGGELRSSHSAILTTAAWNFILSQPKVSSWPFFKGTVIHFPKQVSFYCDSS